MPANTSSRGSRFLSLPSTSLGRVSAALLLVFFLSAFFMRDLLGSVSAYVNSMCLLSAGITGLIALVAKRERSWLVWIVAVFAAIVIGGEFVQLFIGNA
jgi:hypothetical protein